MQNVKILHTSDWHLGKKLFRVSRIHEQKYFLDWLLQYIKQNSYDLLLISGDIFDTPTPPAEAQECYFNFLKNLSTNTKCAVYIIAGNHDSGRFLEAPLPFLRPSNIEISGRIKNDLNQHYFKTTINDVSIGLFLLPHFRSYELTELCQNICRESESNSVLENLNVLQSEMERIKNLEQVDFSILMAHHLFGKYSYAGSELMLGLTGLESIPTEIFESTFNYLALGHIHKTQAASKDPLAIYPGAPIPMHFGEEQNKFLSSIVVTKNNSFTHSTHEWVKVPNFRAVKSIKGHKDNFLSHFSTALNEIETYDCPLPAFLEFKVDGGQIDTFILREIEAIAEKRDIQILKYSVQNLDQTSVLMNQHSQFSNNDFKSESFKQPSPQELFELFYKSKYQGQSVPPDLMQTFADNFEEWQDQDLKENVQELPSKENHTDDKMVRD